MKVKVDRELCAGLGNCVAYAPTVFALDEENKAIVLYIASVDGETLLEAAESCPGTPSSSRTTVGSRCTPRPRNDSRPAPELGSRHEQCRR